MVKGRGRLGQASGEVVQAQAPRIFWRKGLGEPGGHDGGEVGICERADSSALDGRADPAGVINGAERRLPIAAFRRPSKRDRAVEGKVVADNRVGVVGPHQVWFDAKNAGDGGVGAATTIALGFAVDDPVADRRLGGVHIVALRREVVAANDLIIVAGIRLGIEDRLHRCSGALSGGRVNGRTSGLRGVRGLLMALGTAAARNRSRSLESKAALVHPKGPNDRWFR